MSRFARPFLNGLLLVLVISSSYCPCVFAQAGHGQEMSDAPSDASSETSERDVRGVPPC